MAKLYYSPLQSATATRLVFLQPGAYHQDLQVRLVEVDLAESNLPSFECVSYTWGNESAESSIQIDSQLTTIRKNLHTALRRIRLPDRERVLWVDALSISQTDLDEKAQQVKMIGQIFQGATTVLAWVGEHTASSQSLFTSRVTTEEVTAWKKFFNRKDHTLDLPSRVAVWASFLTRPYWTRAWIVQEIICAQKLLVCCGADSRDWDTLIAQKCSSKSSLEFDGINVISRKFRKGISSIEANAFEDGKNAVERLVVSRRTYWTSPQRPVAGNLAYHLTAVANTKCFDRRDKIYSILSLESDSEIRDEIGVDYTASVSELLVRALRALVAHMDGRIAIQLLISVLECTRPELCSVVDLIMDEPVRLTSTLLDAVDYILDKQLAIPYAAFGRSLGVSSKKDCVSYWLSKAKNEGYWPANDDVPGRT